VFKTVAKIWKTLKKLGIQLVFLEKTHRATGVKWHLLRIVLSQNASNFNHDAELDELLKRELQ